MASPGDIEFESFSINSSRGNIDLANGGKLVIMDFNVYESAIDHHTYADVTVMDTGDTLGQQKFAGDEKVEVSFKGAGQKNAKFKFAMIQNAELRHTGSMKGKMYTLRMCSPELLNSQNKVVNKSFKDQTSKVVEKVVKDYWETEKQVKVKQTKGKQRIVGNSVHPHKFLEQLNDRHVSQNYEKDGSLFSLYETRDSGGEQVIKFETFKDMMDNDSGLEFHQSAAAGSNHQVDSKQIINMYVPSSFFTPYRWTAPTAKSSYNLASGRQRKEDKKFEDPKLPTSESPISGEEKQRINKPDKEQKPQRHIVVAPDNDKEQTYISQSKQYKAAHIARMANDIGWIEVYGNPDVAPGSVIKLKIPNKSSKNEGEEKQITAKVLVLKVKHTVKPAGQSPRYTSTIEFTKAGHEEGVG